MAVLSESFAAISVSNQQGKLKSVSSYISVNDTLKISNKINKFQTIAVNALPEFQFKPSKLSSTRAYAEVSDRRQTVNILSKQVFNLKGDQSLNILPHKLSRLTPNNNPADFSIEVTGQSLDSSTPNYSVNSIYLENNFSDGYVWTKQIPPNSSVKTLYFTPQPKLLFEVGDVVRIRNINSKYAELVTVTATTRNSISYSSNNLIPEISGTFIDSGSSTSNFKYISDDLPLSQTQRKYYFSVLAHGKNSVAYNRDYSEIPNLNYLSKILLGKNLTEIASTIQANKIYRYNFREFNNEIMQPDYRPAGKVVLLNFLRNIPEYINKISKISDLGKHRGIEFLPLGTIPVLNKDKFSNNQVFQLPADYSKINYAAVYKAVEFNTIRTAESIAKKSIILRSDSARIKSENLEKRYIAVKDISNTLYRFAYLPRDKPILKDTKTTIKANSLIIPIKGIARDTLRSTTTINKAFTNLKTVEYNFKINNIDKKVTNLKAILDRRTVTNLLIPLKGVNDGLKYRTQYKLSRLVPDKTLTDFSVEVTGQSLDSSTPIYNVNSIYLENNTNESYIWTKQVPANSATKTLYFRSQSRILFEVGDIVRIRNINSGYSELITVINSTTNSISYNSNNLIPEISGTFIDAGTSIYPQNSVSLNTAPKTARENLYYINLSPGIRNKVSYARTTSYASLLPKEIHFASSLGDLYLQRNVSTNTAPKTPRENLYYINLSPGIRNKVSYATTTSYASLLPKEIHFASSLADLYLQRNVSTNTAPKTPRENLYYINISPGARGGAMYGIASTYATPLLPEIHSAYKLSRLIPDKNLVDFSVEVTGQSLDSSTPIYNVNSIYLENSVSGGYIWTKQTPTNLSTKTLYFSSQPRTVFEVGDIVRIRNINSGYSEFVTVVNSTVRSITYISNNLVPEISGTFIDVGSSIYPQSSVSLNTAPKTPRENLYYINISPGSRGGFNYVGFGKLYSDIQLPLIVAKTTNINLLRSLTSNININGLSKYSPVDNLNISDFSIEITGQSLDQTISTYSINSIYLENNPNESYLWQKQSSVIPSNIKTIYFSPQATQKFFVGDIVKIKNDNLGYVDYVYVTATSSNSISYIGSNLIPEISGTYLQTGSTLYSNSFNSVSTGPAVLRNYNLSVIAPGKRSVKTFGYGYNSLNSLNNLPNIYKIRDAVNILKTGDIKLIFAKLLSIAKVSKDSNEFKVDLINVPKYTNTSVFDLQPNLSKLNSVYTFNKGFTTKFNIDSMARYDPDNLLSPDYVLPVVDQSLDAYSNYYYKPDIILIEGDYSEGYIWTKNQRSPTVSQPTIKTLYFQNQKSLRFKIGEKIRVRNATTGVSNFYIVTDCTFNSVSFALGNTKITEIGNTYIDSGTTVYSQNLVKPITSPVNIRENLYYATIIPSLRNKPLYPGGNNYSSLDNNFNTGKVFSASIVRGVLSSVSYSGRILRVKFGDKRSPNGIQDVSQIKKAPIQFWS